MEANLPLDVVPWSAFGINGTCEDCTVNEAAAAAYMEVKMATNDFAATRERYAGAGLVYAITGLGVSLVIEPETIADSEHSSVECFLPFTLSTTTTSVLPTIIMLLVLPEPLTRLVPTGESGVLQ